MFELFTPRLLLREMSHEDLDALLRIFSDEETMRFYPKSFARENMEEWINWNLKNYQKFGHGLWAMVLLNTHEVIGDCGIVTQQVDGIQELEIGYHVRRDLWGQGLATEAAQTCRDYGFSKLNCGKLISLIHPGNISSRRVAEKIGMSLTKQTLWKNKPTCIYTIERPL